MGSKQRVRLSASRQAPDQQLRPPKPTRGPTRVTTAAVVGEGEHRHRLALTAAPVTSRCSGQPQARPSVRGRRRLVHALHHRLGRHHVRPVAILGAGEIEETGEGGEEEGVFNGTQTQSE